MDLHVYRNSPDRWHDLRAEALDRGAVLATNAVTLDELVQRLTPKLVSATPAQRLTFIDRSMRQYRVGMIPGSVRYAYDAVAELKAAKVTPAELRAAGNALLAHVIEDYDRSLGAAGIVDPQERCWIAAAMAGQDSLWLQRFDSVVIHAIYDLNDAEFELLRRVIDVLPLGGTVMLFNNTANIKATQFAEWTWQRFVYDESLADKTFPEFLRASAPSRELLERLFRFDAGDPDNVPLRRDDSLRILQCQGRYHEIEEIGAEIAVLLDSGGAAADIAVVVRHIDSYGEMIEDVFARYGIPHSFETGIPLLRVPVIKYWMSLLDLVTGERGRDALGRVLSSAYHGSIPAEAGMDRVLADLGYIDRRHLSAAALAIRGNSPLAIEFERFENQLDSIEHMVASPLEFLARLFPAGTLTERDRQAWRILSEEIEAINPISGTIPFVDFQRIAAGIAALRTVGRFSERSMVPGIARVRIMNPQALGYRSYRYLFAPGFADGEVPAPSRANPLLPDADLDALNKDIRPRHVMNSGHRNRREPLHLFMLVDSAMERLTLTYPGITLEGVPIYPSIYLSEISRHYEAPPRDVADRTRAPRDIGEGLRLIAQEWGRGFLANDQALKLIGPELVRRIEWERRGIHRADLGIEAIPTGGVWHPSELNTLAACPFVFLARHRLHLRSTALPDFEIPPAEVGNLAHRILHEFYSQPISAQEDTARERMLDIIARQLAPVDVHGQGPNSVIDPALWRIRRPQLVNALVEYVKFAVEDARSGYVTLPEYLDRSLPPARLGQVLLAGRPDHIATRHDGGALSGIRIDDFKYSAVSSYTRDQLTNSFQIPVYAYLASQALKADPGVPMEGRYLLLRSPSTPVVGRAVDAGGMEEISLQIQELVEKVRLGRLHPDPMDKQECQSCDHRRMCRLYGD